MTQAEVSRALGCSQSFLSRVETGSTPVPADVMAKLAALYDVSESYLQGKDADDTQRTGDDASPRARILSDLSAAGGLRALASDDVLVSALAITPEEWRNLRGCELSFKSTKSGYVMLLTTIRAMERA
jgi:transcriptional regulator with XRE-family HTH domain